MSKPSGHSANFEAEDDRTSMGDLLDDLRELVRDAESLLRQTDGDVGERVSDVRVKIEEKLEDARGRLHEATDGKTARVKNAARSTESYVRENPWTAVLLAAGLGYLIANLGRRR